MSGLKFQLMLNKEMYWMPVYLKVDVDKVIAEKDAEICRLKKALYKACSNWAGSERYTEATWHDDKHREELWAEVEQRCRGMAEKFKPYKETK